jgi:hypothetical protein
MANGAYSARRHAAAPQSLRTKLVWLREFSKQHAAEPRLQNWCLRHLPIAPDQVESWCARAWWGIAAGELTRVYLYDQQKCSEALDLLGGPDWSSVDTALDHSGVILATAHIGPPKFLMNALIERSAQTMILTNTQDMPDWLTLVAGNLLDPTRPSDRSMVMMKAAMHLRSGGLLFAAPDGGFSADHVNLKAFKRLWRFSTGIPMLARRLNVPCFSAWTLWQGNDLALQILPINPPSRDLSDNDWNRAWIADHWSDVAKVIATSPENLRFLAFQFRKEFGT